MHASHLEPKRVGGSRTLYWPSESPAMIDFAGGDLELKGQVCNRSEQQVQEAFSFESSLPLSPVAAGDFERCRSPMVGLDNTCDGDVDGSETASWPSWRFARALKRSVISIVGNETKGKGRRQVVGLPECIRTSILLLLLLLLCRRCSSSTTCSTFVIAASTEVRS